MTETAEMRKTSGSFVNICANSKKMLEVPKELTTVGTHPDVQKAMMGVTLQNGYQRF